MLIKIILLFLPKLLFFQIWLMTHWLIWLKIVLYTLKNDSFNFICKFWIMCSTMCLIFNLYSTFNALFNIQLRIQHSTIHFIFNSLSACTYSWSIIYSTISTIYSQLPPCGHLAITDTPLLRTAAKSPAKVAAVWLK